MKISVVQMNSQGDKEENLRNAEINIRSIYEDEKPDLIVLPEYYASLGGNRDHVYANGETFPDGQAYRLMSALASELNLTIHAGSLVEREGNRYFNTTLVFGPDGSEIARYRKIHLFDIDAPGGTSYRESDTISRGTEVVTYKVGDVIVGCSICYDIRFPELFRALRDRGAQVIVLPAAFTLMTGKDHWEVMSRCRAIETQTYFVSVGQALSHGDGKFWCWGHSMIIDPWGHIIAQCSDGVGSTTARIDLAYLDKVRAAVPVVNHHVL
ncbi:carbon-nitrogen hydrolase family protein [Aquamicrobium lusatiense]|uniref:carbon-nitrogen hydrolase family protein n=1 Tax=Aquamicrobium lusatiense TaxID=89772 RepID=UPI002453A116|nr:carbon-nitrogen hydrolase family protein [Aquamicrobium lusatiense]MDH4993286.1 carbon-nitrogen hydrolase family protein [Aquamicrobium lusatiense]